MSCSNEIMKKLSSKSSGNIVELIEVTLSFKAIRDFTKAYSLDFGVEPSEKEARIRAEEFIIFTRVIDRTTSGLREKRDIV